jgi:hypothetical protein
MSYNINVFKISNYKEKNFIVIPDYQGKADYISMTLQFSKGKVSSTLKYATYS